MQRTYQTITEEFEYKKADNDPLEDFPDIGYAEGKLDKRDIFYTTKEPNKVFVNFLSIKSICHRCKLTFLFKILMYKHLKLNCTKWNHESDATPPFVCKLPLVIKFTTGTKAVRSWYAFKS